MSDPKRHDKSSQPVPKKDSDNGSLREAPDRKALDSLPVSDGNKPSVAPAPQQPNPPANGS